MTEMDTHNENLTEGNSMDEVTRCRMSSMHAHAIAREAIDTADKAIKEQERWDTLLHLIQEEFAVFVDDIASLIEDGNYSTALDRARMKRDSIQRSLASRNIRSLLDDLGWGPSETGNHDTA